VSYARFGKESDVYVYLDIDGYLCCCGCRLEDPAWPHYSTESMLLHLAEHERQGDMVPASCIEGLKSEAEENDQWILEEAEKVNPESATSKEAGR
jgi:hypothetical protein